MTNIEIAQIFRQIVAILQIKGDNVFRIRAYERAAQNIEGLSQDIGYFIRDDKLLEIPGIGKDIAEKIKEIETTGKLSYLVKLKKTIPESLLDLLDIPSVGPKTVKLLYEQLKVKNITDLEKAIKKNRLQGLFGIKEKTINNISKGIELFKRGKERLTLDSAGSIADEFVRVLKNLPEVKKISFAGSLRRQKETVRDIDILVASSRPHKVMDTFVSSPLVGEILAKGETKSSVRTGQDVQVDCRVVDDSSYGAALLYFTGSKNFNIKIRQLAIRKGLKINEYGIFKGDKLISGKTEEEVLRALGLAYVEPELREDNGEIELAACNKLPRLIELKDIKADLHVHSRWSDGINQIEELARACLGRGYDYMAVTDHSQGLKIANGLQPKDLIKKKKEIDALNKKLDGFRILYGSEVDIDAQGGLDYGDDILKEFDVVIGAIHSGFKQSREQITRRIISACHNKYVHVIAHPSGRLLGAREAYDLDWEKVFQAGRDTNTAFEINSFPERMDLNDLHCRQAKEIGVRLAISTDSHALLHLDNIYLGLAMARRGWLSPENVINTLPLDELLKTIKK